MLPPLRYSGDSNTVKLLDQTLLPLEERWLDIRTPEEMVEAIRMLRGRGALAIAANGDGTESNIELRDSEEITFSFGRRTVPEDAGAYNPAFDVTSARLVTAIVTEHRVVRPPFKGGLETLRKNRTARGLKKCA